MISMCVNNSWSFIYNQLKCSSSFYEHVRLSVDPKLRVYTKVIRIPPNTEVKHSHKRNVLHPEFTRV